MSSYKHFTSENNKHTKYRDSDIHNPELNTAIDIKGKTESDNINKNLDKYVELISWCRWNPDLWWDLITPKTGGIRLDLDQRVFLRSLARFISTYGVFPRGYGKTLLEVMGMFHTAIFFPDIELSMTAQTKENASKILEEKYRELVRFYPMLLNELAGKPQFAKDTAEINFTSGGRIDILANQQSSKGARRKRINVEESALLNNALFQDVLEPIVNVPRRTIGRLAVVNPEELNGQINFFTTSGFRGSDEFERSLLLFDEMAELKGKMVIGSDWQLALNFGRGETKSQILEKKSKLSPIFFAQNYESKWVGAVDGALIDINKLMELRVISEPDLQCEKNEEYYLSMDVARSENKSNNQSVIAVLKVKRNKSNRVTQIKLVNIISLPTGLNFTGQIVELKRLKHLYKAKAVVMDINGLGQGACDEALKDTIDPITGESLGCWATINIPEKKPEIEKAEKILYGLNSQGINTDIIVNFINMVDSGMLKLLEKKQINASDIQNTKDYKSKITSHIQTDNFIEEVANLKLKHLPSGKLTVEQATRKVDKDKYSAVAYGLWYIMNFEDKALKKDRKFDMNKLFLFRQPKIRK